MPSEEREASVGTAASSEAAAAGQAGAAAGQAAASRSPPAWYQAQAPVVAHPHTQVPARDAIRKKIVEFSAAVAAGGSEAAAAALSEAELADGGALDSLLSRWGGGVIWLRFRCRVAWAA